MEIREFAERILLSPEINQKLVPADSIMTDDRPGSALRVPLPARPDELRFAGRKEAPPIPPPGAFHDPAKRAVAHHIMANHELQALEIMAATLLAYPEAPPEFRRGMLEVMADEQRHTRMHIERAAAYGLDFGKLKVNGYFWKKSLAFTSVMDYLAGLPLVFEGGNLDHTLDFERLFLSVDDRRGGAVMRRIHEDEIGHVRFGIDWLRRLKSPDESEWEAFAKHLHWPLRPGRARGKTFYPDPRRAAGLPEEFIENLSHLSPLPDDPPSPASDRAVE